MTPVADTVLNHHSLTQLLTCEHCLIACRMYFTKEPQEYIVGPFQKSTLRQVEHIVLM